MKGRSAIICAVLLGAALMMGAAPGEPESIAGRARACLKLELGSRAERNPQQPCGTETYHFELGDAEAGALAGTLGLAWPASPGDGVSSYQPMAWARLSWQHAFAVLRLALEGGEDDATPDRCCALDSTGRMLWQRDLDLACDPRISDQGTCALVSLEQFPIDSVLAEMGLDSMPPDPLPDPGESHGSRGLMRPLAGLSNEIRASARNRDQLSLRLLGPDGSERGAWRRSREDVLQSGGAGLAIPAAIEFPPGSDQLVMIEAPASPSDVAHGRGHRVIRSVASSGRLLWEYDLNDRPDRWLLFSNNGRLIITYGSSKPPLEPWRERNDSYHCSLHAFSADGRFLGQFEIDARNPLETLLIAQEEGLVYFCAERLYALDTRTGRVTGRPPAEPLERLQRSPRVWEARSAESMLSLQRYFETGISSPLKIRETPSEAAAPQEPPGDARGAGSLTAGLARGYLAAVPAMAEAGKIAQPGSQWFQLGPAPAGALAGALGLDWPAKAAGDDFLGNRGATAWASLSWNLAYAVLVLAHFGVDGFIGPKRLCAVDSLGGRQWLRDIDFAQGPWISDRGTCAWIASEGDSVGVHFLGLQGQKLGVWKRPRSEFAPRFRCGEGYAAFEFRPGSDDLVMLDRPPFPPAPAEQRSRQAILSLDPASRLIWEHDLSGMQDDHLLFSKDGRFIVTFGTGKVPSGRKGVFSDDYRNSLHAFSAEGDFLGYFSLEAVETLQTLLIDEDEGLVYFILRGLRALDLETGIVSDNPPLDPLYRLQGSQLAWEAKLAQSMIAYRRDSR